MTLRQFAFGVATTLTIAAILLLLIPFVFGVKLTYWQCVGLLVIARLLLAKGVPDADI